jgi:hypothetical protein
MAAMIETSKVARRRQLKFNRVDEILADVERLAQCADVRALGNWSSGQVVQHLAMTMNNSVHGFEFKAPFLARVIVRTFMKRRFLTKTMPAGFKLPDRATDLLPPATSFQDAVSNFRQALEQLKKGTRRSSHPALGQLTREEWDQLHCRHSELHLSFLVPAEQ